MQQEKMVVLDFGGQFNQLIARRVREAGVYCEIFPCTQPVETYADETLKGIILTGGPQSVYASDAETCSPAVFELGVPVLGICYGMQVMTHLLGGRVETAPVAEYGFAALAAQPHPLFANVDATTTVWMSHRDAVCQMPSGFTGIARTDACPYAAFANDTRKLYGVQFHPEVNHTRQGMQMLRNFLFAICGCKGDYHAGDLIQKLVEDIRTQVGEGRVICALSGGVDSSVAAVLIHKAIGERLTCVFVDHGLLRKDEAQQVLETYRDNLGLNILFVDASQRFLDRLRGVSEPERKRKIIGEEFIRVFEEASEQIHGDFLAQGTIYPDVIESGRGNSAAIKSHHNVGGLPKDMRFQGVVEPLRMFFKDEVRALGVRLGIPHAMLWRQPFPGPGLAIRVMGEITPERLRVVRESDAILREEFDKAGLTETIWQFFTVDTGVKTVGVMGDDRTYENCVAIRAVVSEDAMTVDFAQIPYPVLARVASRIVNEVSGANRVVYDITSKPPGTIEWE